MDPTRPERTALLDRAPELIAAVEALSDDALSSDLTGPLMLTAVLGEAGLHVSRPRVHLAPVIAEGGREVASWQSYTIRTRLPMVRSRRSRFQPVVSLSRSLSGAAPRLASLAPTGAGSRGVL